MKKFNHSVFLRERGFSLLELMVVVGMIGGMALTITKIGEMGNRSVRTNEYMYEKNSFIQEIERYMLNKDFCEATLKNTSITDSPTDVSSVKSNSGREIFTVGETYGNRAVKFKKLTLQADEPGNVVNTSVMASVVIEIEKMVQQAYGSEMEQRRFSVQVKTDENGRVETCYSATDNAVETARQMICEDFGGTFNDKNDRCEKLGGPVKMAVCEMTGREYDEESETCVAKLIEFDTSFCHILSWSGSGDKICPNGHIMLGLRPNSATPGAWTQIHCCPLRIP